MSIVFANIKSKKNTGDFYCTPYHYFNLPNKIHVHLRHEIPDCHAAIFGGGALHGQLVGPEARQKSVNAKHKIAWGIGASKPNSREHPPAPREFDLVGVREYGRDGGEYVPCASCMHPFFDSVPEPNQDIVTFYNADPKIVSPDISGFASLRNDSDINSILSFIASGETLLTNSFHGCYWGLLMKRKVICLPYSSKFFGFHCPPTMATAQDWRDAVKNARSYENYLDDCRNRNLQFFWKVCNLIFG